MSSRTRIPVLLLGLTLLNFLFSQPDSSPLPRIDIILSARLLPYQHLIQSETRNILRLYTRWFGPLPADRLTIADSASLPGLTAFGQNLVIINQQPVPFTRLLQRTLATEIARHWFAANSITDPFLSQGLPSYGATRYLEAVYGENNLLNLPVSIPMLSGASDRYLHQLYYYLAAVNNLTRPLSEPLPADDRFVTAAVYKSQAVLILKALENELGTILLDSAIRSYRRKYLLREHQFTTDYSIGETVSSPATPAFLAILTALAGPRSEMLITQLFQQTGSADLKINRIYRQGRTIIIPISCRNAPNLPVTVQTVFNDRTTRTDTIFPESTTRLTLITDKKVRRVIIDPDRKILEPDRWNNIYPRRLKIVPIFALPDFESYQLFYGPWFWYDNYRGFQPGVWFQGRKFIDGGPARGEHNWTLIQNYASKKSDWHTGFSYQTPLLFYPIRLRLYLAGDNSFQDRGLKLYFNSEIGRPFRLPLTQIQFGYRLYELQDTTGRDPRAWNRARTAELRTRLYRHNKTPRLSLQQELICTRGLKLLLSEYNYTKISLVENITITPHKLPSISFRLFAGAITGSVPLQEKFYLSGGLSSTPAEPISWAYQGVASGQEHWHYDGDANCRGYYGSYRSGRFAWGINIHLLPERAWRFPFSAIQPFFDAGNVADSLNPMQLKPVLDLGIRLKLGPLYADFPFWKSSPQPRGNQFAFRWSLGFKLSELFSGI